MFLFLVGSVSALEVSINNHDPSPAETGRHVNVWFKVQNEGQQAGIRDDVFLEIVPKDGLALTPGEPARKSLGFLRTGQEIVKYRLIVDENAIEGPNLVEAYLIVDDARIKYDLFVEVKESQVDLQIGDIESDPTRIKPQDEDVKLEVTVINVGQGDALSVKAELTNLPEGITLSDSYSGTSLLGNINSNGQGEAQFFIDVDKKTPPKEYNSILRLIYKPESTTSSTNTKTVSLPLRIAVRPVPLYEVTSIQFQEDQLQAGLKEVKMKLSIKNIGEEDGESVRVKVYAKTEQPFTFDVTSDFVAPILEPGETGEATLEFDIADDANLQTFLLDVEIKSVVGDDVITYQESVPVKVSLPKEDNPWSVARMGLLGLLVLGLVVGYRYYRKKSKGSDIKKVDHKYGHNYLDHLAKKKKK